MPPLPIGARIVAALFAGSSVIHAVRPQVFEGTIPDVLPYHRALVYVSGVAEIVCAAGLLVPRTRRYAAIASAALLVVVFPANVQTAVDAGEAFVDKGASAQRGAVLAATLVRLPLQWPLIRWAWRARLTG